jgi:hypothetical protein
MHWNFAKLQLNALALRGLSPRQGHLISDQRRHFVNAAIVNAIGTLNFVVEDPSIRNSILGVPLYIHTMITYASVFLLKVHLRWKPARLNMDLSTTTNLIDRAAQMLGQVRAGERHLAFHISRGLNSMITKLQRLEKPALEQMSAVADMNNTQIFDGSNQEDWSGVDSGSDVMFGDMGGVYGNIDQEYFPPVFFDMTQQMPV